MCGFGRVWLFGFCVLEFGFDLGFDCVVCCNSLVFMCCFLWMFVLVVRFADGSVLWCMGWFV